MGLVLVRFGEISLKGRNRAFFSGRLRRNLRACLNANGLPGRVWQEGQRVYVEAEPLEAALPALQRVFGVVSLSPIRVAPADLRAIVQQAIDLAVAKGLGPSRSFRVEARRADKLFPHTSPEIERCVGGEVAEAVGARVDLSRRADVTIGVEVHRDRSLVYGDVLPGPGGMPLGSQGKVVALLSGGIDSPVAAWLMMKRGCTVIPVHFYTDQAQAARVQALANALSQYAYGSEVRPVLLPHHELLSETLGQLQEAHASRWTCLFCKRAMLQKASELADALGAAAVVTGDSLGQVASQTLANLEVVSHGIAKPILRPLIGMDKTEIMVMARSIGTFELSTLQSTCCPYLPANPVTEGSVHKLREVVARIGAQQHAPLSAPAPSTALEAAHA